jgi:hypothetical protein
MQDQCTSISKERECIRGIETALDQMNDFTSNTCMVSQAKYVNT